MGSASSKHEAAAENAQHAAAKAAKAEFKAREARRKAECVAKGVPFTKGKFVPPGYYDVRPGEWPVQQQQRDMSGQMAGSYYGHGQSMQTRDREGVESQYGPEVALQPEERVPMAAGGRLYPQIAAQARPQPQMVYHGAQQQQPAYTVVELRGVEYGESHTPWQSGAAKERYTGPIEAWQRHKAELLQRKKEVDDSLRNLASRQHEQATQFQDITLRERQLRLAEEEEMERRAEIRRQRAELKHREQQLKEREAARDFFWKEERRAEEEAQKYRKTAATAEGSKLELQKRELETEMQREQQYMSQAKALGDAEAARLEKIRIAEANLKAQQDAMDKEIRQLRMREYEHQRKVESLSVRERELSEEERRVRQEQAAKEKRAAATTDRNYQREKAAVDAEFEAIKKRREALDKAEKDSQELQNKLHREIQETEKQRNKTRSEAEKAAMEREKAVGQKPVVSSRDIRESVQSAFQCAESQHPDQPQTQPTQQIAHRAGETSFQEKHTTRHGWEKVTGSSEATDVSHGVPGSSGKETAGKGERDREHARPMSTQAQQRVTQHEDTSARANTTRDIHVRREIES